MAVQAKSSGDDEGKIFAVIAYLLGIIGFLIVLLAKKDNKFAMYHAKQSLVLSIAALIIFIPGSIVTAIIGIVPVIGWIIALVLSLVMMLIGLGFLVFVVLGIINAINLQMKPLPIIGKFADKFNF